MPTESARGPRAAQQRLERTLENWRYDERDQTRAKPSLQIQARQCGPGDCSGSTQNKAAGIKLSHRLGDQWIMDLAIAVWLCGVTAANGAEPHGGVSRHQIDAPSQT